MANAVTVNELGVSLVYRIVPEIRGHSTVSVLRSVTLAHLALGLVDSNINSNWFLSVLTGYLSGELA